LVFLEIDMLSGFGEEQNLIFFNSSYSLGVGINTIPLKNELKIRLRVRGFFILENLILIFLDSPLEHF